MKKFLATNLMTVLSTAALAVTPFNLNGIEVKGVNQNQEQNITQLLKLQKGEKIDDKKIADIVKKLYATGNFDRVAVDTQANNLIVDVQLKQIVASLNFKGNSLIPTEQIRKTYEDNNVRQGSLLNKDLIDRLNEEVSNFYQSQGYSQVAVSTRYQTLDDGTVNVTVYIDERSKAYLKELTIKGNNSFTQDQILADSKILPNTHWYNFYTNSNFNAENKTALLNNITNFYKERGYAKFKILSTDEEHKDVERPQNIFFTVDVAEGNVYKVSAVDTFSKDQILDNKFAILNQVKVGDVYDISSINETSTALKDYLATLGYAQAVVEPVYNYDEANHTVKVTFAVDKGQRYTVNTINFKGNYLTKDYVIRRQLMQQENAIYDLNLVQDDVSTLMRSGWYSNVDYSTKPVANTPDLLDLTYNLKEAPNGSFQIGVGYGDTQGVTFNTKFQQSNFLGTGRNFGIDLQKSNGTTSAQIDLVEPYFTTSGISLNTSVYYSYTNTAKLKSYSGYNYTQRLIGATIGTTIPLSRYSSLTTNLNYEYNYYYNLYPEYYRGLYLKSIGQLPEVGKPWKVHSRDLSLNLSYNYNTYNRYLFPTKGNDFTVSSSLVLFGSTNKYVNFGVKFRNFTPLDKNHNWVVSTRFQAAHARGLSGKFLPINSLYAVGGQGTLRGMKYGSIGPLAINCSDKSTCDVNKPSTFNKFNLNETIGGDTMVSGGFDLFVPIFRGEAANVVRTSLFVDAAAAWSTKWKSYTKELSSEFLAKVGDYSKPKFRATAGASLEWQSPMGLLSFSVGVPIVKQASDERELFSINFGASF